MSSIFGIEVVVSDAVRDADGKPAWRLIPKFPSSLDVGRRGHPFTIEQALSESSLDVRIVCHPEFIEDLLKELNDAQKGADCGIVGQGHRDHARAAEALESHQSLFAAELR